MPAEAHFKFRARVAEITGAVEHHTSIKNPVIETSEDATGLVNTLIQAAGHGGYINASCTLAGNDTVTVVILPSFSNVSDQLIARGTELQGLIFSTEDRAQKDSRFVVVTRNSDRYVGVLRGGSFSVDGQVVPADKVHELKVWIRPDSAGSYVPGWLELVDGLKLTIRQWTTGVFRREYHINLSGDVSLAVDGLNKEVRVEAGDIEHLFRERKVGTGR